MLDRPDEALERLSAARDISQREGYDAILPHLTGRLATALARTGQAEMAVTLVEELLRRVDEQRTGRLEVCHFHHRMLEVCHFHIGYGEALFRAGRGEEALRTLDLVVKMAREMESRTLIVRALGLRALIEPEGSAAQQDISEQARL